MRRGRALVERSGASLPGRRGLAPHRPHGFSSGCRRVSVKTRLPIFPACAPRPTGAMHGAVRGSNYEPPISSLTTNRAAHIEKPENQSLWGYRFRVVPWRDKVAAFPRGFFYSNESRRQSSMQICSKGIQASYNPRIKNICGVYA